MGSCSSCCRREGTNKRISQTKEDTTQVEDEKVSVEKVAEEQAAVSDEKPRQKPSAEKNISVSKEWPTKSEEGKKLSKESDRRPPSIEKAPSSNEQLSKQSAMENKNAVDGDQKIGKDGKIKSREKGDAKKQDDNSESDVVDYWLTAAERKKAKSKELPVDKTTDLVLSVVQPPQVDYAALPPHIQASLHKKEVSSSKPPQAPPVWIRKESSDAIRRPESYGVADRPIQSAPSARKPYTSWTGKETSDKIREPEAYGVADRPTQTGPSVRKPFAPQAYGVADRPVQQNSMVNRPEHVPEAYGVADRPVLAKPQAQPPKAQGVFDRPSAVGKYASSRQKPMAGYYQTAVARGFMKKDQAPQPASETANVPSARLKAENLSNQEPASPGIHSYKLYGEKGFTVKSNERSDYRF